MWLLLGICWRCKHQQNEFSHGHDYSCHVLSFEATLLQLVSDQKKPGKRVDQKTAKKPHAGILFGPLRQPIAIGKTHQPGTLPGCKSSGIQRRLPGYQLRIALAQTGAIVRHQGVTQLVFPDQSVRHSTSLGPFLRFLQAPEMLITQAIDILPVCFLHPGSC